MKNDRIPLSSTGLRVNEAALLSKAVNPRNPQIKGPMGRDGQRDFPSFMTGYSDVASSRARKNRDNKTALKLLPDEEAAIDILTSSILSPSEMMESKVSFICENQGVPAQLKTSMLATVTDYFKTDYNLNVKTSSMLKQIFGISGSYVQLILPEAAVDHMINKVSLGMESASVVVKTMLQDYALSENEKAPSIKNIGILSNKNENQNLHLALNSFFTDEIKQEAYNPFVKIDENVLKTAFESVLQKSPESLLSLTDSLKDNGNNTNIKDVFTKAFESFGQKNNNSSSFDKNVSIIDNPDAIRLQKLVNANAQQKQSKVSKANISNTSSINNILGSSKHLELENAIFGRGKPGGVKVVNATPKSHTLSRTSVGEPLIQYIPSESVLPIHTPGEYENHIGYFILVDGNGSPIDMSRDDYSSSNTNSALANQGNTKMSNMFSTIGSAMFEGARDVTAISSFSQIMYEEIMEREMLDRVKSGLGMRDLTISKNSDFYKVMLSRSLSNQYTQLLYVPREYISYIAFEYDENGLGKALIDDLSVINMLRVLLMYNDILVAIKNSTGKTVVEAQLDPKDNDPMKTASMIADNIVRSRTLDISRLTYDQNDIMTFLQRAGYEFQFTGNPKMPETKVTINTNSGSAPKSDPDLNDNLKKASSFKIGVPMEMVDNSFNTEFAITSVLNNTMFGKKVIQLQSRFASMLTDFTRKLCIHDANLYNSLLEQAEQHVHSSEFDITKAKETLGVFYSDIDVKTLEEEKIKEAYTHFCVDLFISQYEVHLPRPPSVTLESQKDEIQNTSDMYQLILDNLINEDYLTAETQGDVSMSVSTIKALIKSTLMRDFLSSKGIAPEITSLGEAIIDGVTEDVVKRALAYVKGLTTVGLHVSVKNQINAFAASKTLQAINNGETPESSVDSGTDSADAPETSGDEFPMDDSIPEGDTPEDELPIEDTPIDDNNTDTKPPKGEEDQSLIE